MSVDMNHSGKADCGQLSTGSTLTTAGKAMFDFGLVKLAGAPKEVLILLSSSLIIIAYFWFGRELTLPVI